MNTNKNKQSQVVNQIVEIHIGDQKKKKRKRKPKKKIAVSSDELESLKTQYGDNIPENILKRLTMKKKEPVADASNLMQFYNMTRKQPEMIYQREPPHIIPQHDELLLKRLAQLEQNLGTLKHEPQPIERAQENEPAKSDSTIAELRNREPEETGIQEKQEQGEQLLSETPEEAEARRLREYAELKEAEGKEKDKANLARIRAELARLHREKEEEDAQRLREGEVKPPIQLPPPQQIPIEDRIKYIETDIPKYKNMFYIDDEPKGETVFYVMHNKNPVRITGTRDDLAKEIIFHEIRTFIGEGIYRINNDSDLRTLKERLKTVRPVQKHDRKGK